MIIFTVMTAILAEGIIEDSYNLIHFRALDGISDAAAWSSILSILMKLYPEKVAFIMSWGETVFGLGYTIGNKSGNFKVTHQAPCNVVAYFCFL